jgi:uncharacterized DUF497 family protein
MGSSNKNKVNIRTHGFSILKLHCSAWDLEKTIPDKKIFHSHEDTLWNPQQDSWMMAGQLRCPN